MKKVREVTHTDIRRPHLETGGFYLISSRFPSPIRRYSAALTNLNLKLGNCLSLNQNLPQAFESASATTNNGDW